MNYCIWSDRMNCPSESCVHLKALGSAIVVLLNKNYLFHSLLLLSQLIRQHRGHNQQTQQPPKLWSQFWCYKVVVLKQQLWPFVFKNTCFTVTRIISWKNELKCNFCSIVLNMVFNAMRCGHKLFVHWATNENNFYMKLSRSQC